MREMEDEEDARSDPLAGAVFAKEHTFFLSKLVDGTENEYAGTYTDAWDAEHVKLPSSKKNCFKDPESQKLLPKWPVVVKALGADIKSVDDLRVAVMQYNQTYYDSWDFDALAVYLEKMLSPGESEEFFASTVRDSPCSSYFLVKDVWLLHLLPLFYFAA